ncbi:MAG: flavoprotein [Gammaproteobacteria bacterium]
MNTRRDSPPRFAWGLTGSGHFLEESLEIAKRLPAVDFFLSRAVEEVLKMYGCDRGLREAGYRLHRDNTASSVPVGELYRGAYHTFVMAPATSNTVAKCVAGISDNLVSNFFAQAGKCRIESIVYACDTEPVVITPAPGEMVTVYPRRVDLECAEKLGEFEYTTLVKNMDDLGAALERRVEWAGGQWPNASCS